LDLKDVIELGILVCYAPLGVLTLLVHYSFSALFEHLIVSFTNSRYDCCTRGSVLVLERV
jgi:hypothetical protein